MDLKELISKKEIDAKITELSGVIINDFGSSVYAMTVLEGARVFSNYLIQNLRTNSSTVENDYIKLSSYNEGTESSGKITIKKNPEKDYKGKKILIIEDIIDTGLTLKFLKDYLTRNGASQVKICTLLDKPSRRTVKITPDYCGFTIQNLFVVGFGIDFNEQYRELPCIYYIEPNT
ncbi:Xanthine phosphoribosyltransferase [Candidatus Tiddalikarchaeum anstoanum]|nr:Xanthine phosphoribosyltransferase [Candidatus Tiddalikarchaeum anstoanum]